MATIQTRKTQDGTSYRVQVRLRGHPPVSASFGRKTDAKTWAQQTETAIREGRYFPTYEAKRRTLADLVDRFLEQTQAKRDAGYYATKKHLLTWWKEKLGDYTLDRCTPALIAEYRDKLLAENIGDKEKPEYRTPATANRFLAALSKAFSVAVKEWQWLQENPLKRVQKEKEPAGRVRYLSDEERKRLLEACRKSKLPELYLIVMLALTTGMRRGEIVGLRWPDVDLERRLIVLNRTKNRERRSVPIVPEVAELLRDHGKVRRLDTDLVFASDGKDPVWFDKYWYRAMRDAKVKDFRFHDLRHTAASYLAMSHATLAEIAAVLGHKTLAMVKRYAHLSDQHTEAVVERMTRKYFSA
jgi:integrase